MSDLTTIASQLRQGHTVVSFNKGVSMEPLLHEGKTYVVLKPITGELEIGDLPLFQRSEGVYILHRLIGKEGNCYITRGDNCIGSEKTPRDRFLGVVTEIQRNGKIISVKDPAYLRYVKFWCRIYPARKVWMLARLGLNRLKGKLYGIKARLYR